MYPFETRFEMFNQPKDYCPIFENSPIPTVLTDQDLKILWSNPAAHTRYPSLSLPGGLSLLFPTGQVPIFRTMLFKNKTPFIRQFPLSDAAAVFTPFEGGCMIQVVSTQYETQQSPLAGSDLLIANLNSQLRLPLSGIFSSVSSVARMPEVQDNERIDHLTRQINGYGYQLLRFSINVTAYLRYVAGIEKIAPMRINLCEWLKSLCHAAGMLTSSVDITLTSRLGEEPVFLNADADKLSAAVLQVIANSCRFSREGNAIEVSLTATKDAAIITVCDQGLGIPAHLVDRVFEPFFSYDHGGRPFSGAGLGLSIAYYIVAQHHGAIALSSTLGEGTTVVIRLPLADAENLTLHSAPQATDLLLDRFSSLHILLSDVCGVPTP
jgi:signal transduction histidine kinase